jgi:hypothetical protein
MVPGEVLALLRREGLVAASLVEKMLAWLHTGFSAHNAVRVGARDASARRSVAQYMLRAPLSLEKMSYDPESCTFIYRSRMHKTAASSGRRWPGSRRTGSPSRSTCTSR